MLLDYLPVMIRTKVIHQNGMTIYYPQIFGMREVTIEQSMNETIFNVVEWLIDEQHRQQNSTQFAEMIGTYEIKTNERNILSLSLSNYAMMNHAAHGLTFMKSLTMDIQTGHSYTLAELFKEDSNYVDVLSAIIAQQIEERDLPTLIDFTKIRPDQDFYVADKSLVIYFQQYELSAYVFGFPMFPISLFELQDIIAEDGPLATLATNS